MSEMKRKPIPPMRGRGMPVAKGAIKKGTFSRLIKTLFKYYKAQMIIVLVCMLNSVKNHKDSRGCNSDDHKSCENNADDSHPKLACEFIRHF